MSRIAVAVPTIPERADIFAKFMEAWQPLFDKHKAEFIKVLDGKYPTVIGTDENTLPYSPVDVMGEYADCLSNLNAGIRNLGFAYIARYLPEVEYIVTLDDDVLPIGDPIQDHIDALNRRVPISWMSTASEYTRGFPYGLREEAEVVLSHGVWEGVADWDAPTQLVLGSHRDISFPKCPIPKGIFYPMCSMNLSFKRKMLPYIYHAPWELGIRRFDDILAGTESKKAIDKNGWAAVTGYARVNHERASNVFNNLEIEAAGIKAWEAYCSGDDSHPYFKLYREKLERWQSWLKSL